MKNLIKKTLLSVFILNSQPSAFGQKAPEQKQKSFKLYMLGHAFKGCPENSSCSKKTGLKRKKWISTIKENNLKKLNQFKRQNGIPIGFWLAPKKEMPKDLIYWQSPCAHHDRQTFSLKIAELFSPHFSSLVKLKKKEENVFIEQTFTFDKNKKIIKYYLPSGEYPLMTDGQKIYFIREEEGHFYGLDLDRNGKFTIIETFKTRLLPEEVSCPKALLKEMKEKSHHQIYLSYFCKAIWNKTEKNVQTFIFGWSCH